MAAPATIDVLVETPAGSRTKYAWDPDAKRLRAKTVLPLGTTFPFDFGCVLDTEAEDGDPIDVLVLADEPLAHGCLVECRVIGVLEIQQAEKPSDRTTVKNDRVIAVPVESIAGARWKTLGDLGPILLAAIEDFFRSYVERQGRKFRVVSRGDARRAAALVERAGK